MGGGDEGTGSGVTVTRGDTRNRSRVKDDDTGDAQLHGLVV